MKAISMSAARGEEPTPAALRSWEKFFFEPADPTLLGVMRILVGCVGLYTVITWGMGLMGFVGPHAWMDDQVCKYLTQEAPFNDPPMSWDGREGVTVEHGNYLASPYFHITDPVWVWTIHLSIIGVFILFTIGYQTRITAVLAWLGLLCYIHRCSYHLFGMDTMTNIMMIYLCIGPSGAALSVDRWLEVRRLRQLGVKHIDPPAPSVLARVALRLIQIHFCIIYLASGSSKLQGPTWWNGTALWGCFANITFAPVSVGWYQSLMRLLSSNRLVWEFVMTTGVMFTFLVEIGLPFLIWTRLRWLFVIGSLLLHLGIGLLMGLTTFSMLMMCMVMSFTPPELVRPYLESFRGLKPVLPPRAVQGPHSAKQPALATSS